MFFYTVTMVENEEHILLDFFIIYYRQLRLVAMSLDVKQQSDSNERRYAIVQIIFVP